MRSVAISCLTLLLAAALAGGACLPCFGAAMTTHGCCGPSGYCETAGQNPTHCECAAPTPDFFALQVASSHAIVPIDNAYAELGSFVVPALSAVNQPIRLAEAYSSPDLYLRNSVLNI